MMLKIPQTVRLMQIASAVIDAHSDHVALHCEPAGGYLMSWAFDY